MTDKSGKGAGTSASEPAGGVSFDQIDSALSDDGLSSEETQSLLNFDAFGGEEEEEVSAPSEAGKETPATEGEAAPEGDGETVEPGTEEGEPPLDESPTTSPELSALLQQVARQNAAIEELKKTRTAPSKEPAEDGPAFNFTVPDQLMALLGSEDPGERKQAVSALAQGIARETYRTAMGQVQEMLSGIPQVVQTAIQQENSARTVFEDFYGKHSDLNRPELRPVIMNVAQTVMAEEAARQGVSVADMSWSEKLRDEIAKRSRTALGIKPAASSKGGGKPPAPLPKGGGAAPRPKVGATASTKPNSPDDIAKTLFGPR